MNKKLTAVSGNDFAVELTAAAKPALLPEPEAKPNSTSRMKDVEGIESWPRERPWS